MIENVLKTTATRVETDTYIIEKVVESRYTNTDIANEVDALERQNAEYQRQIDLITSCIQANTAKIAEYNNALKSLPPLEIIKEEGL